MAVHRIEQRTTIRRRLVTAGRVQLAAGGVVTTSLINDVCRQVGLHPYAFRSFFTADHEFFGAINDSLVDECASRLRAGLDRFAPAMAGDEALVEAAIMLANSWPLTRGGMVIRANRRLQGLVNDRDGEHIVESEHLFVGALLEVFSDLMVRLDRRLTWSPKLAVRVILDTYERSFELWLLSSRDESTFSSSSYVLRTLPSLLGEMSAPLPRTRGQ